jgi:hypothetical protein
MHGRVKGHQDAHGMLRRSNVLLVIQVQRTVQVTRSLSFAGSQVVDGMERKRLVSKRRRGIFFLIRNKT